MRQVPRRLCFVEEEIDQNDPAIPGDDKIRAGDSRRFSWAPLDPSDPPAVANFLGIREWLVAEITMSGPERARDSIDLVATSEHVPHWFVEDTVFRKDLVDRRAPALLVVLAEDVIERLRV